ncbi:MAG: metal-dependent hydrolase [Firmicutes bacterium]|nr:metal-dependent hydrolase [Bacillota bacterium]
MALEVKWVGHATFELRTASGRTVVIDPWYTGSPVAKDPLPDRVDFVLLTHDHFDHVKDVAELARRGAKVVTQPETGARLKREEGAPEDRILDMNLGGTVSLADDLQVTMIPALHTSNTGVPSGYIVRAGGFTVAHLGDTALFRDLELYGEMYPIDLALVPIGDHYTMGPRAAARAVAFLKARVAAPMHYRTFPVLARSAEPFVAALKDLAPKAAPWVPEIGESRTF